MVFGGLAWRSLDRRDLAAGLRNAHAYFIELERYDELFSFSKQGLLSLDHALIPVLRQKDVKPAFMRYPESSSFAHKLINSPDPPKQKKVYRLSFNKTFLPSERISTLSRGGY